MKICAVIVTYNRLGFLEECLSALLNQSLPLEKIIIVNNDSTDGTTQYLNNLSGRCEVIHQQNIGGAGGFNTGMRKAYNDGYDWIWTMDDDVEPALDCLSNLMQYSSISKCLHPLRVFSDTGEVFKWEHYLDYRTCMPVLHHNISLQNKDYCFVNTACFEGMLVHRDVITMTGFPKKEHFIAGDDTEFGVFASHYTNILYTSRALMYRKRTTVSYKLRPLQAYYEYRNLFLLRKNIHPYFPGNRKMFQRNLQADFIRKTKNIIRGKEYSFKEKKRTYFQNAERNLRWK